MSVQNAKDDGYSRADGNCSSRFPPISSTAAKKKWHFLPRELSFETVVCPQGPGDTCYVVWFCDIHNTLTFLPNNIAQIRWDVLKDIDSLVLTCDRKWPTSLWGAPWQIHNPKKKKFKKSFNFSARKMLKPLKSITSKMEPHTSRLVKLTVVVSQRQGAGATAVTWRRSCLNWEWRPPQERWVNLSRKTEGAGVYK